MAREGRKGLERAHLSCGKRLFCALPGEIRPREVLRKSPSATKRSHKSNNIYLPITNAFLFLCSLLLPLSLGKKSAERKMPKTFPPFPSKLTRYVKNDVLSFDGIKNSSPSSSFHSSTVLFLSPHFFPYSFFGEVIGARERRGCVCYWQLKVMEVPEVDEKEEEEEAEVRGGRAAAFYHQLRCCVPPFSSRRHQKKSGGSSVLSTLLLRTFLRGLLRTRRRTRRCQKGKKGLSLLFPSRR